MHLRALVIIGNVVFIFMSIFWRFYLDYIYFPPYHLFYSFSILTFQFSVFFLFSQPLGLLQLFKYIGIYLNRSYHSLELTADFAKLGSSPPPSLLFESFFFYIYHSCDWNFWSPNISKERPVMLRKCIHWNTWEAVWIEIKLTTYYLKIGTNLCRSKK